MIDVAPSHLAIIRRILARHLPHCEVRAFGSRVTWTAKDYSDLDLAVVGPNAIDSSRLRLLREAFETSAIPFRVDVIDWHTVSEEFRRVIDKNHEVVQKPQNASSSVLGEWAEVRFRDLIEITRDGEWGSEHPDGDRVEMLVIRGTDFAQVRVGDLSSLPRRYIERSAAERKKLRAGDVLIETAGGTKDQSTGRCMLMKQRHLESAELPLICASFSRFVRFDNRRVEPEFMYWWLQDMHASGEMEAHQVQHTGVARFQFTRFTESVSVLLPPLTEQRAIAYILGTLDSKIELNRRMTETLEAMARALFKSWFVNFDPVRAKAEGRDPGLPKPLADLFPARFVDSELGEIPEGWEVGTLGDVAQHPRRVVQPEQIDPETVYIALEHMPKRCVALSDWGTGDGLESNKFEFKRGEILFGKLRPYFHKVGVAPSEGVCSTDIVVITPKEEAWFGFVLGHVSSVEFVDYTDAGSTGTKMPRTSWTDMARFELPLPPKSVGEAFTEALRPTVDRIISSIHESRTVAALRETLLPKLISGELRVSDADRVVARADA